MDTTADGVAARQFERQHGLITVAQARQAGLSRSAIRHRLDPEGRFTNQYLERVLGPVTT